MTGRATAGSFSEASGDELHPRRSRVSGHRELTKERLSREK